MTFDGHRNVVVLSSGSSAWSYDGTTWTALNTMGMDQNLAGPSLVYDPTSESLLLYGGYLLGQSQSDVWQLGTDDTWRRLETVGTPAGRSFHTAVYDTSRRRMLTIGGNSGDSLAETWTLQLTSDTPDEVYSGGVDEDNDGAVDCDDPDCTAQCGAP